MSDYIKHKEYKLPNGRTVTADFNELGEARITIQAMDALFDILNSSEQQWTPCSERLPDKSGRYLVTNTRLGAFEVTWNIFYNGKGEAPEGWLYEDGTIAWMPLPEPYKGEES